MKYKIYFLAFLYYSTTLGSFHFVNYKDNNGVLSGNFFKNLIEEFNPSIFVETGTFRGETAKTAASFFSQVHTVELGQDLYKRAKTKLANDKNVTVYCDSSPEMIKKVAPTLQGHVLFWLDAHYSGGDTVLSHSNHDDPTSVTPIREELKAIQESITSQNCTILIDDIRGFGTRINNIEYLGCWAYPSIQEICDLGKKINPNFSFALLGDILLMYDGAKFNPAFSPVAKACTATRLYDGVNLTNTELIENEKIIMNAQGDEKAMIVNLYQQMTNYKDPLFQHDLWYAFVSMGSKNRQESLIALEKVSSRFENLYNTTGISDVLNSQRIDNYISATKTKIN